ncbi:hypothetical protein OPV22_020004 [Ensete ventricosum]|uniref:NAC domain-containing protein n=1 Tax=Ensete ventricosum TaxID=4639 RepID=A0AAV8QDK1_ENSVE|nr:hypothetical protein OPV22_020004 [Ensete ventricosum]
MDDIDGMPLAKRRRLPILTSPFSSPHGPSTPKRSIDFPVERVSMEVPKKWPGLPRGVNFNPSDEDLLWHLVAKVGKGNADPHPFIHEFITCLDEFEAFGYTHPQKLPGIRKDGSASYFFHRSFKTCIAEIRQHEKMCDSDFGDVCWQKSGISKSLIVDGKHQGYKTMMILYENASWVMHQYHLGVEKIDQEEFVVSKIFHQRTWQVNKSVEDLALSADETVLGEAGSLFFSKMDHHLDLVNADATSQDILMDGQDPKPHLSLEVYNHKYPSDGSEKIDAQVRRSNSDMIPDSEVEGHIAKTGGNDIIQSFNLPNHLVDAKTEHLDCNTNLLIEGTDGIPAAVTGVHAKDDELDHVLLHVRTHMLLSSMKSGTTDSICSSDSSSCGLNHTMENLLHAKDGGFVPQNDSMSNMETTYRKDILGPVQDISSCPLVNNATDCDPGREQYNMQSPKKENSCMDSHIPESGNLNMANNIMADPPGSSTAESYSMVHQCSNLPCCQNNTLLETNFSEENLGNNGLSSYHTPQTPVFGERIVNTDCRPSRSGVSGQLISLKTETMEEVYTDDVSEANRGLEFGAHGLGPLEKHVIGISGTTALSSSEVRMCPEVNLLKTNKFQTDQMICNCSRDANTLDPQLLALGQSLEDQNNGNDVLDSVLPSINSEVKVEPLEEICTHNGLGTTAQKPVSSSLEATSRKPTWSSGSGYSAKTKKHIEYSLTDKHCQDMLASDSCNSQRKTTINSLCSEPPFLKKDLHLNSNSLNFLNSACSRKGSNSQENVFLHKRSSIEQVGNRCSHHASITENVHVDNTEAHISRTEVKEYADDFSKDMQADVISPKPEMLACGVVSFLKYNNNVNNLQRFLPQNKKCEPVNTPDAQVNNFSLRRKGKKTATDSVERALEEDAPGLLQVLLDKGITIDEIKLYGATDDDEALEISSSDDNFEELETVITKIFSSRTSLLKFSVARHMKGSKAVYCLSCLISLIEQTRYLQFRSSPVEWGWCRDLQSFIFVFQTHNRIVLERPEYGYATYFFELVDSLPIGWQIKRLVTAMKLTSCSRTTLIENRPLLVGEDLTEGEARVLEEYGWTPNCGLGTMLNYCDRVVHDKKYERYSNEWRAKIGRLLMEGHDAGRTILVKLPKRVVKHKGGENLKIKVEN